MNPISLARASESGAANDQTSTKSAKSTTVSKDMFLQLLVAQLKNQDPLNPTDNTAFVGQLAQFQQMEQAVNSAADITAIRADMDQLVALQGVTPATSN